MARRVLGHRLFGSERHACGYRTDAVTDALDLHCAVRCCAAATRRLHPEGCLVERQWWARGQFHPESS